MFVLEDNLVSFNGDGHCEEDTAWETDVRDTIENIVESQEDVAVEVQGGGYHEDAAC